MIGLIWFIFESFLYLFSWFQMFLNSNKSWFLLYFFIIKNQPNDRQSSPSIGCKVYRNDCRLWKRRNHLDSVNGKRLPSSDYRKDEPILLQYFVNLTQKFLSIFCWLIWISLILMGLSFSQSLHLHRTCGVGQVDHRPNELSRHWLRFLFEQFIPLGESILENETLSFRNVPLKKPSCLQCIGSNVSSIQTIYGRTILSLACVSLS